MIVSKNVVSSFPHFSVMLCYNRIVLERITIVDLSSAFRREREKERRLVSLQIFPFCTKRKTFAYKLLIRSFSLSEAEVKNEVQDCPETDSLPGGELYIDENAEEKEQEYSDSMEKADYGSLYGANQYYNR